MMRNIILALNIMHVDLLYVFHGKLFFLRRSILRIDTDIALFRIICVSRIISLSSPDGAIGVVSCSFRRFETY